MVDLLWKDGLTTAAVRLEMLWNQLARTHDFSLLCGYSMGNFYKESLCEPFDRVCHAHSLVMPAESLRDLSALQQRAGALEEVTSREAVHRCTWYSEDVMTR